MRIQKGGIAVNLMGLFRRKGARDKRESMLDGPVEAIVAQLQRDPRRQAYCYLVLFGDRPLTAPVQGDESILVFSSRGFANSFIEGYSNYYRCEKPLSVLPLDSVDDLWTLLHAPSLDAQYKLPLGMTIDFSYSGGSFEHYGASQLTGMGVEGVAKGLRLLWERG